jgi:hypothetical protein
MQIIHYTIKNVNTKDPLREISTKDQAWLTAVFQGYILLASADSAPDSFKLWFDEPMAALPKQPRLNYQRNSPRSFSQGVVDKLTDAPHRRDLSPQVCQAIETLSQLMSQGWPIDAIQFQPKGVEDVKPKSFKKLFGN